MYGFLPEGSAPEKRAVSRRLMLQGNLVSSPQIINEFSANALRAGQFREAQIVAAIESFHERCRMVAPTKATLLDASALRGKYSPFWDSPIVASALEGGASVLYSEDMHDGLLVRGKLRIVNPFAQSVRSGA
jgi:predicted nucleic acid-binding protein